MALLGYFHIVCGARLSWAVAKYYTVRYGRLKEASTSAICCSISVYLEYPPDDRDHDGSMSTRLFECSSRWEASAMVLSVSSEAFRIVDLQSSYPLLLLVMPALTMNLRVAQAIRKMSEQPSTSHKAGSRRTCIASRT